MQATRARSVGRHGISGDVKGILRCRGYGRGVDEAWSFRPFQSSRPFDASLLNSGRLSRGGLFLSKTALDQGVPAWVQFFGGNQKWREFNRLRFNKRGPPATRRPLKLWGYRGFQESWFVVADLMFRQARREALTPGLSKGEERLMRFRNPVFGARRLWRAPPVIGGRPVRRPFWSGP